MDKAWASEAQDRGSIPRGDAEIFRKAKFDAGQVPHQPPKLKIARSSRAGDTKQRDFPSKFLQKPLPFQGGGFLLLLVKA